jgi:hypothetical protein
VKRPRRFFITISLVIAVVIVTLGICIFLAVRRPPGIGKRETIKCFSFSSDRSLDEWQEKRLSQNSTEYSVAKCDGRNCVKAVSKDSASALFYRKPLFHKRNPFISWDWKPEKFPSRKNKETLNKKAEFDFVAQVYVIFYARFFLNSKAIQYVWTHDVPTGAVAFSPYTKNVKLLVLESGESDQWKHEERDIKGDYRNLFGEELEKDVTAISFMTDSDSTGSDAAAYYGNIEIGYLETVQPVVGEAEIEVKEEKEPEPEIKPKEEAKPELEEEKQPEPEVKEEPQPVVKEEPVKAEEKAEGAPQVPPAGPEKAPEPQSPAVKAE